MSELATTVMSADEFLDWTMGQPDGRRYELAAGKVVAMAPERVSHARCKAEIFVKLREAVRSRGLPCEVYVDGMAVRIDTTTVYEPDVLLRCGNPLPDDAIVITDPLILVEVLSPSTSYLDAGAKLEDYFRLSSVRHYLIVKTQNHSVIHHARGLDGTITTRILRDAPVELDPPGIVLSGIFD